MKKYHYSFFSVLLFFVLSACNTFAVTRTFTGTGNWNTAALWGGTVPAAGDDVIINGICTINVNVICNSLVINAGANLTNSSFDFTVTTTTNNAGTFVDNNDTGNNIFSGLVTNSGTWTSNFVVTVGNMNFSGGITNSGTFNAGGATFTATQSIGGTTAMSFANDVAIPAGITVTNNNSNTITIIGVLNTNNVASTWVQGSNSTLNYQNATMPMNTTGTLTANTCTNTVNYSLAGNQAIKPATYCNLSITGDNTKTLQGTTTINGTLAISNTLNNTAPTLDLSSQNITVLGTTIITGAPVTAYTSYGAGNGAFLIDNTTTGTNTFTGLVSLALNGDWNTNTTGVNVIFQGGISNSGRSFIANTANFNGTQNITGASITRFNGDITISAGSTVSNSGFVYAAGRLEGATATANWTNIGFLKYDNGNNLMSVGTLNASTDYNTVDYICNCTQVIKDVDYYNLSITNNTKTMNPSTTRNVNGMLTVRYANFTVNSIKLDVKLASIGTAAIFNNATTATASTTSTFNQNTCFTGKFDVINASNDNDSYVYSNSGSDLVLQRGTGGGVYAVKTTNFTTAPTQAVVQFEIDATNIKFTNNNIATILIGDGFTNDLTRNTSTARLQINFDATAKTYSITHPDGTATTSAGQNSRQTVTWVINRGAGAYTYTDPLGNTANSVAANQVDIWVGTTQFVNDLAMETSANPINDVKIIYDAGSTSGNFIEKQNLTISNLRFYLTPPVNISGVINRYTSVSAINAAKTQLSVASTTGFAAGNRVLVMQMKGATIATADLPTYGDITNYNDAGKFEFARITSIVGATTVNLTSPLLASYTPGGTNAVQLIYVPEYTNVTIDGLLTAQAWNPATQTGGVLALAATRTVTMQADVDVSALGFKGGIIGGNDGDCNKGTYVTNNTNYGQKGEGIATDTNDRGRGKLANGGGGGNPHNSGGGGGGNFGKGAKGARQWNCNSSGTDRTNDCTDEPSLVAPDTEQNSGGAGAILDYTTGRIFLGGGGGSGQQNNSVGTSGANGGGIIIILAKAISGNGFLMSAKGQSVLGTAGNDAGGGGGAGGAIFLETTDFPTTLRVNVQGGKGGDVDFSSCHGNGGGGGGGVLRLQVNPTPANITVIKGGGPSSRNADNSDCALTGNSYFCAEATGDGGVIFNDLSILPVTITKFEVHKIDKQSLLEWTTLTEINAKNIEIERSTDGFHFETIAEIATKGSINKVASYSWIDANPKVGLNYYRLKFIDVDKKTTNSAIQAINFEGNITFLANIYPNPANKNGFSIALRENIDEQKNIQIFVYDMLGRNIAIKIQRQQINNFQVSFEQNTVPTGMYLVDIFTENQRVTKKLVIE